MYFNPSMNKLPPPVHPLSILGLPGIAHNNICVKSFSIPALISSVIELVW